MFLMVKAAHCTFGQYTTCFQNNYHPISIFRQLHTVKTHAAKDLNPNTVEKYKNAQKNLKSMNRINLHIGKIL